MEPYRLGDDGSDANRRARRVTAELQTAIDLGPAPRFNGRACADCGRTYGLENDRTDAVANTGPSSDENLKRGAARTMRKRRSATAGRVV